MFGGVLIDNLTATKLGAALPNVVAPKPFSAFQNSWTGHATFTPQARLDAADRVCFQGWLTAGTTTGGTTVATLPAGIPAPPVARYFVCPVLASQTSYVGSIGVQITNGGSIVLRGTWPTGGTELVLDEIGYFPT